METRKRVYFLFLGMGYTTPHFLDKAKGKTLPLAKTKKRDGKKEQVRRLIQVESGHRGVERG
ncbi:MAG: hypothetical protein SOY07_08720, partial [Bacteroidales bacterium]|nr:hypothetical protein [Bacteroidales bacterium]